MILTILSILVVPIFFAALGITLSVRAGRQYGLSLGEADELSWPALQLVKGYRKLPAEARPYGDIHRVVKALDIKCGGKEKVNKHFTRSDYEHSYKRWCKYSPTHPGPCGFEAYTELREAINEIGESLAEREHALAVAGVESDLAQVQSLTESLRAESTLIKQVTKELT